MIKERKKKCWREEDRRDLCVNTTHIRNYCKITALTSTCYKISTYEKNNSLQPIIFKFKSRSSLVNNLIFVHLCSWCSTININLQNCQHSVGHIFSCCQKQIDLNWWSSVDYYYNKLESHFWRCKLFHQTIMASSES